MEKRLIVIIAMPGGLAIDITGPSDVFSCARQMVDSKCTNPLGVNYQLLIASPTRELSVTTDSGLVITCQTSIFDVSEKIDTLIIGGNSRVRQQFSELIDWLKKHFASIKRVCSVCIGAFILAEAGLLKNKDATTHWMHCSELSSRFELIRVDPNSIFVKDGHIYTSAGASAGIDLSLALVEEDFGRDISLDIARTLVLYLRRPGNQSQFSNLLSQQFSNKKPVRELQQWIQTNLKANLNVQVLAEKVSMSPRNFARVFFTETGFTPAKYIERLRVEFSKRYLEETNYSLEQIAHECGFGSTDTMRNIFLRTIDTTPYDYRSLFGSN